MNFEMPLTEPDAAIHGSGDLASLSGELQLSNRAEIWGQGALVIEDTIFRT